MSESIPLIEQSIFSIQSRVIKILATGMKTTRYTCNLPRRSQTLLGTYAKGMNMYERTSPCQLPDGRRPISRKVWSDRSIQHLPSSRNTPETKLTHCARNGQCSRKSILRSSRQPLRYRNTHSSSYACRDRGTLHERDILLPTGRANTAIGSFPGICRRCGDVTRKDP